MDYTVRDETYRRLVQMSHLHYTVKSHHLQWNVHQLCQICHHFYQNYCFQSSVKTIDLARPINPESYE